MYAIKYICPTTNDTKSSYRSREYFTVTEAERNATVRSEHSGLTYLVEDMESGQIMSAWKNGQHTSHSPANPKKKAAK